MENREIVEAFKEIVRLLELQGETAEGGPQARLARLRAYRNTIRALEILPESVASIYQQEKFKGLRGIPGIGEKNAQKIEEFIKKGRIKKLEELRKKTAVRQVVTHFFESKGLSLQEVKNSAKKQQILYSRFTRPAEQLIALAGSVEAAKQAIDTVASWASSRKLDYAIETVFKKWLELDRLKPKEVVKKPFYQSDPMIWSPTRKKWYVISKYGEWLLFAGKESEIEWKIVD